MASPASFDMRPTPHTVRRQSSGSLGLLRSVVAGALALFALLALPQLAAAANPQDGYQDGSISGASDAPSGSKPESKLWFNDGFWWGSLFDPASDTFRIYRLNQSTEAWQNVGPTLDSRTNSRADALWDGTHLYIASHVVATDSSHNASGQPSRLWRLSYNGSTDTYSVDPGYPVAINNVSSETLVIEKDSTGALWATWTQAKHVYIAHSTTDDATWSTPSQLTISGTLNSDDIVSAIAFGGNKVGLMWSNQSTATMYFSVHVDGTPDTSWSGPETAASGSKEADDHINLKADSSGRVYAAVKTSKTSSSDPLINLLVRGTGGSWAKYTWATVADSHTRPIVVIDEAASRIRVFATGPYPGSSSGQSGGTIYEKDSPLGSISFPSGEGTPVIQDPNSGDMNNVTGSKQPVTATTGLVLLATNDSTNRYWHADLTQTSTSNPPVADFKGTPTSGQTPLIVQFTDLSSNAPGSWSWSFGDGGTSTSQNPAHTYTTVGTYTVSLTATNDAGSDTKTRTGYISVTQGGSTATFTLTPVADSQVKSTSPTSNYGTLDTLRLREASSGSPTYHSYLRFKLSGLAGTVQSVTLRLFVTDASSNTTSVYPVTDTTWSELGITWDNAPSMGPTELGSVKPNSTGAYVDIGLPLETIAGNGLYSFGLREDGTNSAIFASREDLANAPQLVIVTSTSGGGNTVPTADAHSASTVHDTPATLTLSGSDPETCELTFAIASGPSHGTLGSITDAACTAGGDTAGITYTPAAGYVGSDAFTYTVDDGTDTSSPATFSLSVTNATPTAAATSGTTAQDTPLDVTLSGTDADPVDCELTFAIASEPSHGTVAPKTANACVSGSPNTDSAVYTYTPSAGYSGADSFTYTVSDGIATSSAKTVSLTVTASGGGNTVPTADAHSASTVHDTPATLTLSGSDPETCELTFAIASGPSHGTLGSITDAACTAGGDTAGITYTPAAGYVGSDAFTYTVDDGTDTSSPATFSLSVTNATPTAAATSGTTAQDTPLDVTLSGTDADPVDCELTFAIASEPSHGTVAPKTANACVSGSPNTDSAVYTYTPSAGYSGADSFTYTVSDGIATSSAKTVSLTVTASGGGGSGIVTVNPTADAEVYSSNPDGNHGTLSTMKARLGDGSTTNPTYRDYLTFDVEGVTGTIQSVTLRLFVNSSTHGTISVVGEADTSWTETGITYATAPAPGATALGTASAPTAGVYIEVTLAPNAVSGNGLVSFVLLNDSNSSAVFNSREAPSGKPELVVDYGP